MALPAPKPRRSDHTGSVGFLPQRGLYYNRVQLGGVRRTFYGTTQKQADAKARAAVDAYRQGHRPDAAKLTVAAYLRQWIDTEIRGKRPGTWTSYDGVLRVHIVPHPSDRPLGSIPLGKLKPADVDRWIADRRAAGLADATLWRLHAILRAGLNRAVKKDRLLLENPASQVAPIHVDEEEVRALTAAQARAILAKVADTREHAFYAIAFALGPRQGELLGLRWEDVDLEARTLAVRQQWQRGHFAPLKRSWHRRVLPLSPWLVGVLQWHAGLLERARDLAGDRWKEHGLVFPSAHGTPQTAGNNWRAWHRLLKRLEIPPVKFHGTRHTAASLMLQAGVPLWQVSKILGHRDISTTARIYSHLAPEGREEVAAAMANVLNRAPEPPTVLRDVLQAPALVPGAPEIELKPGPNGVPGGW